jgi:hypothetical protein
MMPSVMDKVVTGDPETYFLDQPYSKRSFSWRTDGLICLLSANHHHSVRTVKRSSMAARTVAFYITALAAAGDFAASPRMAFISFDSTSRPVLASGFSRYGLSSLFG